MRKNQLDISEHKIWKDKNISPEGKQYLLMFMQ